MSIEVYIETLIKLLNQSSTLILVIITYFYATKTKQMAEIMQKQITPDIYISDMFLGTSMSIKNSKTNESHNLNVSFLIRNRSSASGSIVIPSLILKSDHTHLICKYI